MKVARRVRKEGREEGLYSDDVPVEELEEGRGGMTVGTGGRRRFDAARWRIEERWGAAFARNPSLSFSLVEVVVGVSLLENK